jgi:eukaryotic-like serine/threonine-protein kinase
VLLGRSPSCELVVSDNSVSRRHCSLLLEGGRLQVTDLGSSHGIKKNGELVADCWLQPGEHALIGLAELRLESTASAPLDSPENSQASATTNGSRANLVGQQLGGYLVRSLVGAGGQAVVYAAEQVRLGREVAIKVLRPPEEGSTHEAAAAFLEEARAAAALSDPTLVHVFDLGFDQGRHFLSMELVRGGSLATRIRQHGAMTWAEFEPLLADVLTALTVAHNAGIVHRDVKPANILLTGDGHAKLADLGLARGIGGDGDRKGTPAYMAPEQVKGEKVDARADLYALGCTIFHALTGAPPFTGRSKDILKQKFAGPAPRLPDQPSTPSFVARAVAALLERNPADRPADLQATISLLRPTATARVSPVRRNRPQYRPTSATSRSWPWILVLIATITAAVLAHRYLQDL